MILQLQEIKCGQKMIIYSALQNEQDEGIEVKGANLFILYLFIGVPNKTRMNECTDLR